MAVSPKAALLALMAPLLLAACETMGTGGVQPTAQPAPLGAFDVENAVDGLTVGHRLMAAREFELALKAYHGAVSKEGLTADVLSAIGSAHMKLGRYNQAQKFLEQAIEKDENFVPAWNNLGVVQMNMREVEDARASFQRAYALDSGSTDLIRQNLLLAIDILAQNGETPPEPTDFFLVRRGKGDYLLLGS